MADSPPPLASSEPAACRNCGVGTVGAFCAACGQETGPPRREFSAFVHELLGSFFAFDGRVWRTLGPLFVRPGRLTRAWVEGQRASLVPPLRLFLFFTILLFLIVNCRAGTTQLLEKRETETASAAGQPVGDTADNQEPRVGVREDGESFDMNVPLPNFWPFTRLEEMLAAQEDRLRHMDANVRQYVLARRALELAPIGLLMLLPLMAFFLQLWWMGTGSYWLDHLVFLLHAYAFCCGLIAFLVLVPLPDWVTGLTLGLGVPWHFHRAMRTVYRRGFWRTLVGTLAGGFLTTFAFVAVCVLLVPYLLLTV